MENNTEKRSDQQQSTQPGNLDSFNQHNQQKSTEAEGAVKDHKDESESYADYNGNSEANAPARARE